MIADLLLRPDNRLLGGATGDFSLFGGQPTPGVTFARENVATGHVSIAAPAGNNPVQGAPAPSVAAASSPDGLVDEIPSQHNDGAGAPASVALPSFLATATSDSSAPALDDLVPTALSSGGLVLAGPAALGLANSVPAPSAATTEGPSNPLAPAGSSFGAPALDQLVPQIGTLTATIAPIADVVSDLVDTATPVAQAVVDDVVDPIAIGAAHAVDSALAPATDTVAPVVAGVADIVAPVTGDVAAAAAPALSTVADVVAPVGTALGATVEATAPVVAAITPAVDSFVEAAAPVVDAATDTVTPVTTAAAPAAATIVDAVQPAGVVLQPAAEAVASIAGDALGGSDPEAGVQTLVGMVANADAFDVIAPGSASSEEPAQSVIDDLIGDVSEAAPLLGDHDGAHDDDGTDLFGGHGGLGLG